MKKNIVDVSSCAESLDDVPARISVQSSLGDIINTRYSRRSMIKGSLAVSFGAALAPLTGCVSDDVSELAAIEDTLDLPSGESFLFEEIHHGFGENVDVATGYDADVLLKWGDPLVEGLGPFDPYNQSASEQVLRFGTNNDYVGYLALEPVGSQEERGLLCVNHEYANAALMFDGVTPKNYKDVLNEEQVLIEQASTGCSVVEIVKLDGKWKYVQSSSFNRRLTSNSTEFDMSGPAAAHKRLKTTRDPSGTKVIGTMNNCAGGMTPWGTYLTCEENFNFLFTGALVSDSPEVENYERYGVGSDISLWGKYDKRFDLSSETNEANRFGWVVEIDPRDPTSTPKKRTALGRFKHEGAENVIAPDGRLVVYMGDDQRFEYLYKFVSEDKVDLDNPKTNSDLLDRGTLYVARFSDAGSLSWLPLLFGIGPLTPDNRFYSQADVVIEARRAADLLKATPMDRPEDVVPNADTGKVYVMLTNNTKRFEDSVNIANPRGPNAFGHIIEITEPNGDFTSESSQWDFLIKAGDPSKPELEAEWHRDTSENGWFVCPDNGAIDPSGRLWVSTDQGRTAQLSGTNDGLWSIETEGELKGKGKMFFRCPNGAELCGPIFTGNGENLFLAVQHPGDGDDASFNAPSTRWPDFKERMPPRSSVVVITKKGGGKIG